MTPLIFNLKSVIQAFDKCAQRDNVGTMPSITTYANLSIFTKEEG